LLEAALIRRSAMRKWVLVFLAVAVLGAPAMTRAAVPLATGAGSVTMLDVDEPTAVYLVRYYTLAGTFTVGKKIYTGTVTGQYQQDLYVQTGSFSGNNGKHTFTASNCDRLTTSLDITIDAALPTGTYDRFTCSADIDGTDHARLVLLFAYVKSYLSGQPCCLYAYKGYFIGG
jgi:hypothetical protein